MKITIVESLSFVKSLSFDSDIWTASGGCFLNTFCVDCPFDAITDTTVGGCLDFRLSTIRQLNITSYPYVFEAADLYPELFI